MTTVSKVNASFWKYFDCGQAKMKAFENSQAVSQSAFSGVSVRKIGENLSKSIHFE